MLLPPHSNAQRPLAIMVAKVQLFKKMSAQVSVPSKDLQGQVFPRVFLQAAWPLHGTRAYVFPCPECVQNQVVLIRSTQLEHFNKRQLARGPHRLLASS